MSREPKPTFDTTYIRNISEAVYRERLGPADTASMIKEDKDEGQKLRGRASSYDPLTRAYLKALGIEPNIRPVPLQDGSKK